MEKSRRRDGRRKPAAARKRNNLTFRTRDQLRDQLEKVAAVAGRSISEEIEFRLMQSFADGDAFDSDAAALRRIATLMATSFHLAGNLSSSGKSVKEWISDPEVFRRAMFGTIDALFAAIPNVSDEDIAVEIEELKVRLLTRIANRRTA